MEKSETASRGGRIISNKIKLENLRKLQVQVGHLHSRN